ncbi:MAG TPA: hypothetical protein ACFYD2_04685 [Candidatus Avalokitesvara rifleensis]|uniref:hypothetical protein n=1 Tax=Candidatus Avalokitesvara rifleensis TaxID=3367620 RepID=UPI0027137711|nr:hypothetical protein [Candidatus Brocadiales bacterium]
MKTVHEVRVPFTCVFRRWEKNGEPRNVKANENICIVAYFIMPGVTTNIKAGADGWLEIEKWIKGGDLLEIGTLIAKIHLSIPI